MTTEGRESQKTILVVDDEEDLLSMVARFLKNEGYLVVEARNPAQAIAICADSRQPLDLLLSDYGMPGMTGLELARTLREIRPHMRMRFMSGNVAAEEELLASGFVVIRKPFLLPDLLDAIREALGPNATRHETSL
jgi:two-component system cell cycle sensor histidine kinase/response regulator CckA